MLAHNRPSVTVERKEKGGVGELETERIEGWVERRVGEKGHGREGLLT